MPDQLAFAYAEAHLPDQRFLGHWRPHQQITLQLTADRDDGPELAVCELDPDQARELAFRLLVLAEHAHQRAHHDRP